MMKINTLIAIVSFTLSSNSLYNHSFGNQIFNNKGLPLVISFIKTNPPDSIQRMVKNYFQGKKYKVITFEESMELFQAQAKFDLMNAINSGTLNEKTAKTLPSKMNSYSNVLSLTIYRDSTNKKEYAIDSIQYIITQLPVKETPTPQPMFIPDSSIRLSSYAVINEFSEKVINSKLLK